MLIKEKVLEEIDTLNTQQLFDVYSLITILKGREKIIKNSDGEQEQGYLKIQKILSKFKGNLSDYIIEDREDRV
jgi:hypothetical protein